MKIEAATRLNMVLVADRMSEKYVRQQLATLFKNLQSRGFAPKKRDGHTSDIDIKVNGEEFGILYSLEDCYEIKGDSCRIYTKDYDKNAILRFFSLVKSGEHPDDAAESVGWSQ